MKRTTKADRQDKARRDEATKKAGKELRAHLKKLLADNLERVSNISDDEWAAAVALDDEEL